MSNFPPGYSEDGDAAQHGRETAIYQELLPIKAAFDKWLGQYRDELPSDELKDLADDMEIDFETIADDLNQPL